MQPIQTSSLVVFVGIALMFGYLIGIAGAANRFTAAEASRGIAQVDGRTGKLRFCVADAFYSDDPRYRTTDLDAAFECGPWTDSLVN